MENKIYLFFYFCICTKLKQFHIWIDKFINFCEYLVISKSAVNSP